MPTDQTPPAVMAFDQGLNAVRLLSSPHWGEDEAARTEALVRSNLAAAQQTKAASLIQYLTADKRSWPAAEHALVRKYLSLPELVDDGSTPPLSDLWD